MADAIVPLPQPLQKIVYSYYAGNSNPGDIFKVDDESAVESWLPIALEITRAVIPTHAHKRRSTRTAMREQLRICLARKEIGAVYAIVQLVFAPQPPRHT